MQISQVIQNLENTIKAKEAHLQRVTERQTPDFRDSAGRIANYATAEFLELNIDELKKILVDVKACQTDKP